MWILNAFIVNIQVQTQKTFSAQRQIVIEYLQYVGNTTGNIEIIDNWEEYLKRTTLAPPITQPPRVSPLIHV